jgi:hypothetical protein
MIACEFFLCGISRNLERNDFYCIKIVSFAVKKGIRGERTLNAREVIKFRNLLEGKSDGVGEKF